MDFQKDRADRIRIIKTILAVGILLLAFFVQGAAAAVNGLVGIESAVVRGAVLSTV